MKKKHYLIFVLVLILLLHSLMFSVSASPFEPLSDPALTNSYEALMAYCTAKGYSITYDLASFQTDYLASDCEEVDDFLEEVITQIDGYCSSTGQFGFDTDPANDPRSASDKYYYNLQYDQNGGLLVTPNYDTFNLFNVIQIGDIVYDANGGNVSSGLYVTGHIGIVEGVYCDPNSNHNYIRIIESIAVGVCYGLLDSTRVSERATYIYRVKNATGAQKIAAVEFCRNQLGENWNLNLTHDYSDSNTNWLCSQLVWAGYKNQGIDIEINGGPGGDIGVTPHDITINSSMVSEVVFRHPIGNYEEASGGSGSVWVKGWALDNNEPSSVIQIHVYIGGAYDDPNSVGFAFFTNVVRPDVNAVYGVTGTHGFNYTISTSKYGMQPVYVYAIPAGDGTNACLGQFAVYIS